MSTPEGQRLATGSTADSESAPADACMLSHKAADNYSGLHSSNTNMDQAGPHPTAPESGENTVASGAHVDLLAARHPQQVVHDKPEAAAPALPDRGLRLAELHAHIIAGELCLVSWLQQAACATPNCALFTQTGGARQLTRD